MTRFLFFCSGASGRLLAQCPPRERIKYASIGMTVLFTGLFAAIAAFYTLSRVFRLDDYSPRNYGPLLIVAFLSLLWGCFIFTIDRYVLATLPRKGSPWRRFVACLPRIVLAVLIAQVIATPLKILVFEDRLRRTIDEMKQENLDRDRERAAARYDLDVAGRDVEQTRTQLQRAQDTLDAGPQGEEREFISRLLQRYDSCSEELTELGKIVGQQIAGIDRRVRDIQAEVSVHLDAQERLRSSLADALRTEQAPLQGTDGHEGLHRLLPAGAEPLESSIQDKGTLTPASQRLAAELRRTEEVLRALTQEKSGLQRMRRTLAQKLEQKETQCSGLLAAYERRLEAYRQTHLSQIAQRSIAAEQARLRRQEALNRAERDVATRKEVLNASFQGLLTQIEAMNALLQNRFGTVWWTHVFITLLFVVIETAPIIVGLMAGDGPYDRITQRLDTEFFSEQDSKERSFVADVDTTEAKDNLSRRLGTTDSLFHELLRTTESFLTSAETLREDFSARLGQAHASAASAHERRILQKTRAVFFSALERMLKEFEETCAEAIPSEAKVHRTTRSSANLIKLLEEIVNDTVRAHASGQEQPDPERDGD